MTATLTTPALRGSTGEIATGRVFARTCAAEWARLWTVPASWWFLAAAAVTLIGIGTIAGFEAAANPEPLQGEPAWAVSGFAALPAQFALLALALTAVTSDYASGGIVPTLQWTPRRAVLFAARATVAVTAATGLGVVLASGSALAAFTAAWPGLTLPPGEGLDVLADVAFLFAAETALAVGLGFLLRSTAGGLVTVFLLMLVLPILLGNLGYAWTTAVAEILPGSGAIFLLTGEPAAMTTASAVTIMLGWAGGALLLGWLRLMRDDANR